MKKIITLICAIALIAGFSLPLFAGGRQSGASSAAGAGKKHFVFVTPLIAHPVWLVAKEGFEAAAKDYDFRGDWVGPSVIDADEMIKQIEVAIAEKADGIITQGINPEAMVPVLKKADAAGIPVVVVNSDIPDAPRLAYLGTDPTNLGTLGAEAIVKKLNGKAPKVAYMVSVIDYKIGQDIVAGYRNVFSRVPGYEEKTIVESRSDMLTGVSKWQDVFNTYPDVNVAVCVSGEAGASCAKVVIEMGLKDKITIMAIDDIEETLDRMREGVIYGTMTQNFYRKGYQASQWLLDYINTGKRPAKLLNDSGTMLVTKDNIDTYQVDMTKPETWK
jgi:ABC-type sugar transport system substrate-binding protein